mgnify:CR=1 FL=1
MHNLKQRLEPVRLTEEQKRKIVANAKKPVVKQHSYIPIILPSFIVLALFFIMISISPNGFVLFNQTAASQNEGSLFEGLSFAEIAWSVVSSVMLIAIYIVAKRCIAETKRWKTNARVQEVHAFLQKPLQPKVIVAIGLVVIWVGTIYFSSLWYSQLIFVLLGETFVTLSILNQACDYNKARCPHCHVPFTRKQIVKKTYMAFRETCDSCKKPIYLDRYAKVGFWFVPILPITGFWLESLFGLKIYYVPLWIGLMIASMTYFILPLVIQFTDKDTTAEDMKKGGF